MSENKINKIIKMIISMSMAVLFAASLLPGKTINIKAADTYIATISDFTIEGTVGQEIIPVEITSTCFAEGVNWPIFQNGQNITKSIKAGHIVNLPDGLIATVVSMSDDRKVLTYSITGTPKEEFVATAELYKNFEPNANSRFNIKAVSLITDITLTSEKSELTVDDTMKVSAIITPNEATNKEVTWAVSDTNIASIDDEGTVTAITEGTVTVTATAKDGSDVKGSLDLTVKEKLVPVTTITLTSNKTELTVDDTMKVNAIITPNDATNKEVVWTVSDEDIASIDDEGTVTALKAGNVTITATAKDGSDINGLLNITIKEKSSTDTPDDSTEPENPVKPEKPGTETPENPIEPEKPSMVKPEKPSSEKTETVIKDTAKTSTNTMLYISVIGLSSIAAIFVFRRKKVIK